MARDSEVYFPMLTGRFNKVPGKDGALMIGCLGGLSAGGVHYREARYMASFYMDGQPFIIRKASVVPEKRHGSGYNGYLRLECRKCAGMPEKEYGRLLADERKRLEARLPAEPEL